MLGAAQTEATQHHYFTVCVDHAIRTWTSSLNIDTYEELRHSLLVGRRQLFREMSGLGEREAR
jgi:hypothetical protein